MRFGSTPSVSNRGSHHQRRRQRSASKTFNDRCTASPMLAIHGEHPVFVEEFEDMILKRRLLRVWAMWLGSSSAPAYNWYVQLNGQAVDRARVQLPGANALEIHDRERHGRVATRFRGPRVHHRLRLDACDRSIAEVVETLFAIFARRCRSTTLIPAITIPVSLLGDLFRDASMGLSINTLVPIRPRARHWIVVETPSSSSRTRFSSTTEGLPAKDAKAMEEVSGPVIATTLVLLAVFVPTAMMGGITPLQQFAITSRWQPRRSTR